jgi:hypothetical protein
LNEKHLHNVIRVNKNLFIISNIREFKLYDSKYNMIRVIYELSSIENKGFYLREKAILHQSVTYKHGH